MADVHDDDEREHSQPAPVSAASSPRLIVTFVVVAAVIAALLVASMVRDIDTSGRTTAPPTVIRVSGGRLDVLSNNFEISRSVTLPAGTSGGVATEVLGVNGGRAIVGDGEGRARWMVDLASGTAVGLDGGGQPTELAAPLAWLSAGAKWRRVFTATVVEGVTALVAVDADGVTERVGVLGAGAEVVPLSPDSLAVTGGESGAPAYVLSDYGESITEIAGTAWHAERGRVLVAEEDTLSMYDAGERVGRTVNVDLFGSVVGGVLTGRRTAVVLTASGAFGRVDFERGSLEEIADFEGSFRSLIVLRRERLLLVGTNGASLLVDTDANPLEVLPPVEVADELTGVTADRRVAMTQPDCVVLAPPPSDGAAAVASVVLDVDDGSVVADFDDVVSPVGRDGCGLAGAGLDDRVWLDGDTIELSIDGGTVVAVSDNERFALHRAADGTWSVIDLRSRTAIPLEPGSHQFVQL
jgi:hypothetical protein